MVTQSIWTRELSSRRDFRRMLKIEKQSFLHPWNEKDFFRVLRPSNFCEVAGMLDAVTGYTWKDEAIDIINLAVDPRHRRVGIATTLVKTVMQRHPMARVVVCETNLEAQLFFRSLGFTAVGIDRQKFREYNLDGYVMILARSVT